MRTAVTTRARALLDGFWFVPALVALGVALLALPLVQLDRVLGVEGSAFAFGGGAGAARDVLSVITGSVITVAGLTFSLTVVTLQLVAGQYSPRAVPSFLADRFNQVVAGFLLGVFGFGVLVMRTIRSGGDAPDDAVFVPGVAVAGGILLGLVALGVLVLFIHHLASSISVSGILERLGAATAAAIDREHPEDATAPEAPAGASPRTAVHPARQGYVQQVDLRTLAGELGAGRAEVRVRPGAFVTPATVLAVVQDGEGGARAVRRAVVVGGERQITHDADFGLRQLADIGLRALSSGINDPTTAATAVHHLQAALERLAGRELPALRLARQGEAAVTAPGPAFEDLLHTAFAELGRAATTEVSVVLLDALAAVVTAARSAGHDDRVQALLAMAAHVRDAATAGTSLDRVQLDAAADRVAAAARPG